jgi:cytoplasmic iron level regulating protein YaaA (DUF328/UPF0246 family)
VSPPPFLLLPPSEGKAVGGRPALRPDSFARDLAEPRARVLAGLAEIVGSGDEAGRARVLGVRGDLLERAVDATARLVDGTARVLPAWRRYTGVVWAGLEPATMTPGDRKRILVPSGLYGLTTAADPVADYRLRLVVVLGALGRLSTFWRPAVTAALVARARGRLVIDLLPAEHAHAVDFPALARSCRVVRVRFVAADGGNAVGHEAKTAKGRLTRMLLDDGLAGVPGFRFDGWRAQISGDMVTVAAPVR